MSEHLKGMASEIVTAFLLVFVTAFATWLIERRGRLAAESREAKERESKEKAEEALRQIRRRGDAPHLRLSDERFNGMYVEGDEPGDILIHRSNGPELLSVFRDEVDRSLPAGDLVYLVIENVGKAAPRIRVHLSGSQIRCGREAKINGAKGLVFLAYPYSPPDHGQNQTIELWFESESGFQDTHRYLTRHGMRHLVRIDPE